MNVRMSNIITLAIFRGFLGQIIGAIIGAAIVMVIRVLMGLEPVIGGLATDEPLLVVGGLVGVVGFMAGIGSLTDWVKISLGGDPPLPHGADPRGWRRYFAVSYDHKVIGIQYGVLGVILFLMAGLFALTMRTELATSGLQFISFNLFNSLIGLHGMVMIASILIGVAAMMNYLVPMLIGATDMAFPRLNAFAFWINVPGSLLVASSLLFGGFETGWTGYPPLSTHTFPGVQLFFLGVYVIGLSSILGALNIIATTLRMRTTGMTLFRMPIFVWAAFATSLIGLTATQLIGLSFQLVMFERLFGMDFFNPNAGGNVILFQHLFWFYSHPAVYIFVLPGLGIISELLPVFCRKPLFGYRWIALSSIAIALVGFLVWAHHMFTSGMEEYLRVPFMYSTLLVAVPTGVKFFSWVGTLWGGKIETPTPMLFVLGAITVFLFGGLTGPPHGTVSTDLHLHDSYFVVGHFHNTMFGGFVYPFFAAIYYWFPKITGRRMNETMGWLHFWLMTPAFWFMTGGMFWVGLMGMRRRIADYDPALGFDDVHLFVTLSAFLIGISVLVFLGNMIYSARHGEIAEGNLWRSRSPEWQVPSPMPQHNYDEPFVVTGEPYDYGLPGSVYVDMHPSAPEEPEEEDRDETPPQTPALEPAPGD
jgi:cytochrome c oxidase subunit 1